MTGANVTNTDPTAASRPAELLVYTEIEWPKLVASGGRFGRMLAEDVVWVVGTGM